MFVVYAAWTANWSTLPMDAQYCNEIDQFGEQTLVVMFLGTMLIDFTTYFVNGLIIWRIRRREKQKTNRSQKGAKLSTEITKSVLYVVVFHFFMTTLPGLCIIGATVFRQFGSV